MVGFLIIYLTFTSFLFLYKSFQLKSINNILFSKVKPLFRKETALNFDVFGLGPSEVAIIAIAAGLLYGPGKLGASFKERGAKDNLLGNDWDSDRYLVFQEQREKAKEIRTIRNLQRYLGNEESDENM